MATPPLPNPSAELQSQPQQLVPTPQANVTQTAFAQMTQTQIQSYVPQNVWTTDALLDLHAKQKEIAIRNIDSLDAQRKRENLIAWSGIVMVSGIIGFGCYLIAQGNSIGKDIIGATVLFLAGYMAGLGKAHKQ